MYRNGYTVLGIFCFFAVAAANSAHAEPTVIVEDVVGDKVQVGLMELLEPGAVIELSNGESVTLGYLESCIRELISGGRVVVGEDKSVVTGGEVTRETLECKTDSAGASGATGEGAALVFRGGGNNGKQVDTVRLLSRVPVFLMEGVTNTTLRIERVDRREAIRSIPVSGPVFDALGSLPPLTAGGRYRASVAGREVVFIIDQHAAMTPGPTLERLVRF